MKYSNFVISAFAAMGMMVFAGCAAPSSNDEAPSEDGANVFDPAVGQKDDTESATSTAEALSAAPSCIKITREWFSNANATNFWTIKNDCNTRYRVKVDVQYFTDTSCVFVEPHGGTSSIWKFYLGGANVHGRGLLNCDT